MRLERVEGHTLDASCLLHHGLPNPSRVCVCVALYMRRSIKTLWGVDGAADPTKWKALFARIKVRSARNQDYEAS